MNDLLADEFHARKLQNDFDREHQHANFSALDYLKGGRFSYEQKTGEVSTSNAASGPSLTKAADHKSGVRAKGKERDVIARDELKDVRRSNGQNSREAPTANIFLRSLLPNPAPNAKQYPELLHEGNVKIMAIYVMADTAVKIAEALNFRNPQAKGKVTGADVVKIFNAEACPEGRLLSQEGLRREQYAVFFGFEMFEDSKRKIKYLKKAGWPFTDVKGGRLDGATAHEK